LTVRLSLFAIWAISGAAVFISGIYCAGSSSAWFWRRGSSSRDALLLHLRFNAHPGQDRFLYDAR
jgi:hypothetical protein